MDIKNLSRETIKPSAPTPHHLRNYKVSLLDQFAPSSYMPFILVYPNQIGRDTAGILTQLKESLSKVLTIYYPLGGRVKDKFYVECNDDGVEFIEAQANGSSLSEFLKQPDIAALNNFLPCRANGLETGSNIAPAAIKATVFECGGIVIGVCLFHKVLDAAAADVFLNSWAKVARGSEEKVEHPNFTSGSSLFPPKESLSIDFVKDFDNFFFQGSKSFMRRYVFDATAVKTLRSKAAGEQVPNPSRLEALMAFVAEHLSRASVNAKSEALGTLMITHPVNLRQRIDPPLPETTFGNIIWLAFAFYDSDPSTSEAKIKPGELVEILREAFNGLSKESISELETDEAFSTLSEILQSVYTNENIKILRFTSTCNMGFYDIDFGWGKPVWVAHMGDMIGYRSKQQFVLMDSTGQSKAIELWLAAEEDELSILEKDPEFLAYATPNPSILLDSDGTN